MNYNFYHICLAPKKGGLEKMFINYDKIIKNKISIIQENSWISKNINNGNTIKLNKLNILFKLYNCIDYHKINIFLCHDKKSLFYLNFLKYIFIEKIIIVFVNHNHTKIFKTISSDYSIIITKKMDKYLIKENYNLDKRFIINNFSIRNNRKIECKTNIKNIAFIGRLEKRKGCLKMVNQLKNILLSESLYLNIYGDGNEYNEILKFIKDNKLNNNIKLHNWIDDISECYKNNDLIIVPSLYEPFGLVIIDAFYYNCPCILSDTTLINNDIIFDEFNCLTYNINDNLDLEKKIYKLKNNKKLFNYIQINGYDTFHKKLNHYIAKKKLNNCIQKIVNNEIKNKNFNNEFYNLLNKIKNKEYFSYIRFGDSEIRILTNENFKNLKEYSINNLDRKFRLLLKDTINSNKENYLIGIPCICSEKVNNMRKSLFKNTNINFQANNITYNNLFCNSNYYKFKYELLPFLKKNYKIVLICNEKSNIKNLKKKGFQIEYVRYIPSCNAFLDYDNVKNDLLNFTIKNKIKNHVYLFAAACLSNLLINDLYKIEKKNFYIDIGSSLDKELGLYSSRNYLKWFSWRILSNCTWTNKYKFNISCYSGDYNKFERFILKIIGFIYHIIQFLIYLCVAE